MVHTAYFPNYVSPPGETLAEVLEDRGMSQAELARRTGLAKKTINEIIKGKAPITPGTALKLERVLGVPASFWNAREQRYREFLARQAERRSLEAQIKWVRQFPVKEMIRRGWLPAADDLIEQFEHLLRFFGVASPTQWQAVWGKPVEAQAAFRTAQKYENNPYALAAWLRYGERQAQRMACAPYDKQKFIEVLSRIRRLTAEMPPDWQARVMQWCAEAGVAVVFTPQLPGTHLSGATRWISPRCAVLQVSLRYKTDDQLWFSFFHEAAHILKHGKRRLFLERWGPPMSDREEEEANRMAADLLIPPQAYRHFQPAGEHYSLVEIEAFARKIGVSPGIVVGRLQHDGKLPMHVGNKLKRRLEWEDASSRTEEMEEKDA